MTDIHGGGSPIDRTEREMREWLVEQAATGTPELALVGLLTAYGEAIGRLGYVPRRWTDLDAGSRDDRGCSDRKSVV